MNKLHYVNCVLLSEDLSELCVIFKLRGPAELINKFNFIGGKVEQNEYTSDAVVREVMEETGLDISLEKINLFMTFENEEYRLDNHVVFLSTAKLRQAKTCESEKISVVDTKTTLNECKELPNKYSPSFLMLLQAALGFSH